ncbi:homing endonuclease associated repeat-containing protein [Halorubrum sp. SY-15]|jgi:5-methylcytosine-specific restriction endonuclease McrA|uniref:homing endonuclease associated repeat-containing protein n=1 Tax=Halorubrum sp. SY-15 TaxID=3402277 RepID=UPI003EB844A8
MVKKIDKDDLIDDLRRVYQKLDSPPSESQYNEHGQYSASVVRNRFGKFTEGRAAAEIPNPDMRGGNNRIPREDLLDELQRLGEELGKTPTRKEMEEAGAYAENPYRREFGSWSEALLAAGYTYDELNRPGTHVAKRVTVECTVCGDTDQRLQSDIAGKQNTFCSQECLHTWRSQEFTGDAHPLTERIEVKCEWCGNSMQRIPAVAESRTYHFCNYDCMGEWRSEYRAGEDAPAWEGGVGLYRGPNWLTQRKRAVERDGRQCQRCGCTEAEHFDEYGRELSVHHLTPVREFYRKADDEEPNFSEVNTLDNLITLCIECHRRIEKLPVVPQFDSS